MKKTVLLLMVLTALSKCFGLFRDIILSYYYGTSYISDAILISISIPASLLGIAINGIANGFVPIFRDIEENERNYNSNDFSIEVIGIVVIISTIIFFFYLCVHRIFSQSVCCWL